MTVLGTGKGDVPESIEFMFLCSSSMLRNYLEDKSY